MRSDSYLQRREQPVLRPLLLKSGIGGRRRSSLLQTTGDHSLEERAWLGNYDLNVFHRA